MKVASIEIKSSWCCDVICPDRVCDVSIVAASLIKASDGRHKL